MALKKIIAAISCLAAVFLLAACGGGSDKDLADTVKEKGKLVVALNPEFAPFEYKTLVNGKNQIVGSDIKLAQAVADELGVDLVLSEMSFNNVLNSLQSGKADLAISGISATAERKKVYDFSDPYYKAKNVVIVKKDQVDTYTDTDSLSKKSVAVQKGSVQESVAKAQLTGIHTLSLDSNSTMISELSAGKVEAVVLEEPIAKGYVANNPDLALASIELDSSETDSYAIAIPKGNDKLKAAVNKVVKKLTESGDYEKYVQEAFEASIKSGDAE